MKEFKMKSFDAKRAFGVLFVFLLLLGCTTPEEKDLTRAQAEVRKGHYRISMTYFDRVIKRKPQSPAALQAAREGARISAYDLKDFKKAEAYFRHLILYSNDAKERESAQKELANISFENMNDYQKAATEYSRLLSLNLPYAEKTRYQLALARSYFYLGEFTQAESEVDNLLKERLQAETQFQAMGLKGNILVAKKSFTEAAEIYQKILQKFPERSRSENIAIQLALCHEENFDFRSAIQVLEQAKEGSEDLDYIELRIKRLQERLRNQPGARGFRK